MKKSLLLSGIVLILVCGTGYTSDEDVLLKLTSGSENERVVAANGVLGNPTGYSVTIVNLALDVAGETGNEDLVNHILKLLVDSYHFDSIPFIATSREYFKIIDIDPTLTYGEDIWITLPPFYDCYFDSYEKGVCY